MENKQIYLKNNIFTIIEKIRCTNHKIIGVLDTTNVKRFPILTKTDLKRFTIIFSTEEIRTNILEASPNYRTSDTLMRRKEQRMLFMGRREMRLFMRTPLPEPTFMEQGTGPDTSSFFCPSAPLAICFFGKLSTFEAEIVTSFS